MDRKTLNNSELLKDFNMRSNDAFCKVYELFFNEFLYFTKSISNNPKIESEDIIQDAFEWLYTHKSAQFDSLVSIKIYVYKILKNSVLREINRSKYNDRYLSYSKNESLTCEHAIVESELYTHLFAILKMLPDDCARILKLSLEGYSNEEIAKQMDLQKQTVYNKKSKALGILRKKISDKDLLVIIAVLMNI